MSNTIYLATKLWFGKYKDRDKNIYQLIMEDIDYVDWLLDGPFRHKDIDPRVTKMFNEFWERRNMSRYGFRNDNLNK